jgi:hypothetical protein
MGLDKKQIYIVAAAVLLVVAVVVVGYVSWQGAPAGGGTQATSTVGGARTGGGASPIAPYSPEVPKNATLTPPKNEAPPSANSALGTKTRFFDLKATKDGFSPAIITVNHGDTLQVDFAAVDGDYDLDFPYLGAYFSVVKQGTTRRLPIDTSLSGTFAFQCRDHCPSGGVIAGQLVVLP